MWKKVVLSLVLATAMILLALRLVDVDKFQQSMKDMHYAPLVPVVGLIVAAQLLRAFRWWRIVRPVRDLSLARVAPTAFTGFMAINVLPLRAGEVVRPLLLRSRDQVPFSSGLATCVAERVVDALAVFVMLLSALLLVPAQTIHVGTHDLDLSLAVKLLLAIFVPAAIFLAALVVLRGRVVTLVERVLAPISPKLGSLAARILGTFVEGLDAFQTPRHAAEVVLLTATIWTCNVCVMWVGFQLFDLPLGGAAALAVLAITMAGITIPGGIGMSGNYQLFCVAALALYAVDPATALAYAVVMNVVMFLVAVGMGLCALPFLGGALSGLTLSPAKDATGA
jgi:uncharacterized protein (TIRG00374 family)